MARFAKSRPARFLIKSRKMAKKFITLKEASDMSGYSPDYIGQLIRQGKLPGKQVYYNVAWVTTESAVREYLSKVNRKDKPDIFFQSSEISKIFFRKILSERRLNNIVSGLLYAGLFFATMTAFVSFYLLSVSIDSKIEARALEAVNFEEIKYDGGEYGER